MLLGERKRVQTLLQVVSWKLLPLDGDHLDLGAIGRLGDHLATPEELPLEAVFDIGGENPGVDSAVGSDLDVNRHQAGESASERGVACRA